jgi:hypothetical protein
MKRDWDIIGQRQTPFAFYAIRRGKALVENHSYLNELIF